MDELFLTLIVVAALIFGALYVGTEIWRTSWRDDE